MLDLTFKRLLGPCCMTSESILIPQSSIPIGSSRAKDALHRMTRGTLPLVSVVGTHSSHHQYIREFDCEGVVLRICPGKDLAENSLWITVASIFYAFKITPKVDAQGRPVPIDLDYREHGVR